VVRTRHHRSFGVAIAAVGLVVIAGLGGCTPPPDTYVALGDSYTAGPLIPNQSLSPLGCLRSDKNYPSVARTQVRATKFKDVSCSGATTDDFYEPQGVTPGPPNAPQLDALNNMTKIVTIGIGGNDVGFSDIVKNCALQNPFGQGCQAEYTPGDRDLLRERIAAAAPKIRRVLSDARARAPRAQVFIVGYPTVLPDVGNGCYPLVPILPIDVPYLRGFTKALNSMIAAEAQATGAHYIDIYTPSINHDVCQIPTVKWVEGIIPTSAAAPVHPNGTGMRATAGFVAARINQVVTS